MLVQAGEVRLSVYGNEDGIYNLDNTPGVATNYDQAWQLMEVSKPYFEQLLKWKSELFIIRI